MKDNTRLIGIFSRLAILDYILAILIPVLAYYFWNAPLLLVIFCLVGGILLTVFGNAMIVGGLYEEMEG